MSLIQKIRAIFGQQLLRNVAGYRVVRGSGKTGPWVKEGESLVLIPEGIQEVQFPVDVMGSDSIMALVQVSVIFIYEAQAEKYFNFAYDAASSSHSNDFTATTKKLIMNAFASNVADKMREMTIADMVKVTTFPVAQCEGVVIKSVLLSVKPKASEVMAALGAGKTEELVRLANAARQQTRMQAVDDAAELRVKEHAESLSATDEEKVLIAKQAENKLAEAKSTAAAQEELAKQQATSAAGMVASFKGDPMAYALYQLANSGGDITVTTELLAAIRGTK